MTILSFRFMGVRTPSEIAPQIEALASNPASGSWLLWTRTDARDAAAACRLAIETDGVPPGPYNITGAQVVLDTPTHDLIDTYFGPATELRGDLPGHVSPLAPSAPAGRSATHPNTSGAKPKYHPEPNA